VIFLDTNVVSEMMRESYSSQIEEFYQMFPSERFHLPAIVAAEIWFGIHKLPEGQRRNNIESKFLRFLNRGFASRIVPFNDVCAIKYAEVRAAREKMGRPVSLQDAMIGGTAMAFGASLVTRNTTDFDGYGLLLHNPWDGLDS